MIASRIVHLTMADLKAGVRDGTLVTPLSIWTRVAAVLVILICSGLIVPLLWSLIAPIEIITGRYADDYVHLLIAGRSSPLVNNNWYFYGPLYYRLAYLLSYVDPTPIMAVAQGNIRFQVPFFAINFAATATLAWCLSYATGANPRWRVVPMAFFFSCIAFLPAWWSWISQFRPDVLLASLTAASALCLGLYFRSMRIEFSFLAGALLGLAVLTKLPALLTIPGFCLSFMPIWRRSNFIAVTAFIGSLVITYFVVGFPQSLVIRPIISTLSTASANVGSAAFGSLSIWFGHIGDHWALYLLALGLGLLFGSQTSRWRVVHAIPAFLGAGSAFGYFLAQAPYVVVGHWLLYIVATLCVGCAIFGAGLSFLIRSRWPDASSTNCGNYAVAAILAVIACTTVFGGMSSANLEVLKTRHHDELSGRLYQAQILPAERRFEKICYSRYTPITPGYGVSGIFDAKSLDALDRSDCELLVVLERTARAFIEGKMPSKRYQIVARDVGYDWRQVKAFFSLFTRGSSQEAVTPAGVRWTLVANRNSYPGVHLWRRSNPEVLPLQIRYIPQYLMTTTGAPGRVPGCPPVMTTGLGAKVDAVNCVSSIANATSIVIAVSAPAMAHLQAARLTMSLRADEGSPLLQQAVNVATNVKDEKSLETFSPLSLQIRWDIPTKLLDLKPQIEVRFVEEN